MLHKAKKVYFVLHKYQNPGLCNQSIPSPSIQNNQTLGRFCEPLYGIRWRSEMRVTDETKGDGQTDGRMERIAQV